MTEILGAMQPDPSTANKAILLHYPITGADKEEIEFELKQLSNDLRAGPDVSRQFKGTTPNGVQLVYDTTVPEAAESDQDRYYALKDASNFLVAAGRVALGDAKPGDSKKFHYYLEDPLHRQANDGLLTIFAKGLGRLYPVKKAAKLSGVIVTVEALGRAREDTEIQKDQPVDYQEWLRFAKLLGWSERRIRQGPKTCTTVLPPLHVPQAIWYSFERVE